MASTVWLVIKTPRSPGSAKSTRVENNIQSITGSGRLGPEALFNQAINAARAVPPMQ